MQDRMTFPPCRNCKEGRMAFEGGGSMWCDRCEMGKATMPDILTHAQVAAIRERAAYPAREQDARACILCLCDTIEALRARIAELESCKCGRLLSVGLCNVCDNDE